MDSVEYHGKRYVLVALVAVGGNDFMISVQDNVAEVQERIASAAVKSGRQPEDVTLVAVTKTVSPEKIQEALAAGIRHIGENRVQEAVAKAKEMKPGATWHLIGHLQRNKAKLAIQTFDMIHSLDSIRLAKALQKRAEEYDKTIKCLVQVNVTGETTKYGVSPDRLMSLLKKVSLLERLNVRGLMTIAPYTDNPELLRPVFRRLRELAREAEKLKLPGVNMTELSMGMSGDFEIAIEEGATMVRVGTAIFGARSRSETK